MTDTIDDQFNETTKKIKEKAIKLREIDKKIREKIKKPKSNTIEDKVRNYNKIFEDLRTACNKLQSLNENYFVETEEEAGFKRGSKRSSHRVSGRKRKQANHSRDRSNKQEETVLDENQEHDRSWSKKRDRRDEKLIELDDIRLQVQPHQRLDRSQSPVNKQDRQNFDLNKHVTELQEQVQELERELESHREEIKTYKIENAQLKRQNGVLNQEKNEARNRLSQLVSSQLQDIYPNIADLSDIIRPTKIAEQYSELYDNEWVDAYSTLESTNTDKECCIILFDVIKNIYDECRQLANDRFFERVQHCIESPNQETYTHIDKIEMSDFLKQQVKELRKKRAPKVIGSIQKFVVPRIQTEKATIETMQAYMNKCTELCWLMVVQDPPLVLTFQSEPPSQLNEKMFRAYTSRGKYVDFYVWPMMSNAEGSMLSKGVAQGCSTISILRKQTARNNSHIDKKLSQPVSSQNRENPQNVADLSDMNRPTKIAEQHSELYDNEWTDAYSTLESTYTDKECCVILFDVIKNVYDECMQLANDRFFESVQHGIGSPIQETNEAIDKIEMADILKQEALRKKRAPEVIDSIKKFVVPRIQTEKATTEPMQAYMNKCTELCWLMVVQNPPLVLTFQSEPPSQFDEKMFRAYTSRGKYVDFYVWPMMSYTDGSMLSKGVAQGCSTSPSTTQGVRNVRHF